MRDVGLMELNVELLISKVERMELVCFIISMFFIKKMNNCQNIFSMTGSFCFCSIVGSHLKELEIAYDPRELCLWTVFSEV